MKTILAFLSAIIISAAAPAQSKNMVPDSSKKQIVEASCGQCQFGLTAQKGCDLAVRINGQAYFVDGTKIDDHGDAHAADGFCAAIRKAEVKGQVVDGRFQATYFKLVKDTPKKKKAKTGAKA